MMNLIRTHFFDTTTSTLSYLIYDEQTKDTIIIDPVLNYDQAASRISFESIQELKNYIQAKELNLKLILETHVHADHLSGAYELKKIFPQAKIAINERITLVQKTFSQLFNLKDFPCNGMQFDLLLNEKEKIKAGSIEIQTIFTPGHTPACTSFLIQDWLFTGDALFMPDGGTGRCDFPGGDALELYHSVQKLYQLPDTTIFHTGHDYQPQGRELKFSASILEHKKSNIHITENTTEHEFVSFRTQRDSTLNAPKLIWPSLYINMRAGEIPPQEDNKTSYLKIPIEIN
jgi:glyoxylase-like metal-dependent hydrolase (beta-lactamase superfamily II)